MDKPEKLTIGVTEAAKMLGLSRPKVYELARSEGFPSFKVGERLLISIKGLQEWVDRMASPEADI